MVYIHIRDIHSGFLTGRDAEKIDTVASGRIDETRKTRENRDMQQRKVTVQRVWGIALVVAGFGVFYRIPQVMPRVEQIEQFAGFSLFARISFYILGILLISGGTKKIYDNVGAFESKDKRPRINP